MRRSLSYCLRLVAMSVVLLGATLGCHHLGQALTGALGYQAIDQANAKILAVQQDASIKEKAIEAQITAADAAIATLRQAQAQEAANHLFGSQLTFMIDPAPGDYEQIMHSEDLAAATTLPAPDTTTVATKMDQIKKLLADKQHLIDSLKVVVTDAQAKAVQLTQQVGAEQGQIQSLTTQKAALVTATNAQITTIQAAKDVAVQTTLAKDQELLSNKASVDAIKTRLVIAAAALCALLIAAAVFSPLLKPQLAELAAIFGAAAIAIPFVQPWMVATGLGVLLLVVVWHIVETHTAVVDSASATPAPVPAPAVTSTSSVPTTTVVAGSATTLAAVAAKTPASAPVSPTPATP